MWKLGLQAQLPAGHPLLDAPSTCASALA
jgi:hypothetical protein